MEKWEDVIGYEGLYKVSNRGRVKSVDRIDSMGRLHKGRILSIATQPNGYCFVNLWSNGRQSHNMVHRLVASAFIDNPYGYKEINHLNEDKSDNSAENLEWCTHKYNMNYGTGHKRSAKAQGKPVLQITTDGTVIKKHESIAEAARRVKVNKKSILSVCKGKGHTAAGFRWQYAEAAL